MSYRDNYPILLEGLSLNTRWRMAEEQMVRRGLTRVPVGETRDFSYVLVRANKYSSYAEQLTIYHGEIVHRDHVVLFSF